MLNGENVGNSWLDTRNEGRVALAFSRTGKKYGEAELTASIRLTENMWKVDLISTYVVCHGQNC